MVVGQDMEGRTSRSGVEGIFHSGPVGIFHNGLVGICRNGPAWSSHNGVEVKGCDRGYHRIGGAAENCQTLVVVRGSEGVVGHSGATENRHNGRAICLY